MLIYLIGTGMGSGSTITREAEEAIMDSELLIGAKRLLENLPEEATDNRIEEVYSDRIMDILASTDADRAGVILSGDTGFYSGATKLSQSIAESEEMARRLARVRIIPGISSFSYFCSRTGINYENMNVLSAHGKDADPVDSVMHGKYSFFLTGGKETPATLCRTLADAGLGDLKVYVGERLSYEDENITELTAGEAADRTFAPLSVMIVEPARCERRSLPGIRDEEFVRGKVPMTKRLVRVSSLGLLAPEATDICWDVGAGTGSVSIEMCFCSRAVYGIEKNPEAVELLHKNREKFGAWNLRIVEGEAPEALEKLPDPDKVFIGGSSGSIAGILEQIRSEHVTVLVTSVTLETLELARKALEEYGYEVSINQVAVTGVKKIGSYHMMQSENPIFMILGEK